MKPLKLKMQAFGSYVQPAPIDFEQPDQNFFLITGDTGSGKTTIFDAIVFALFGEASSGTVKKDGTELQSQFADPSVSPFVELTFAEGSENREIYRIRREPRHRRPLKRGSGWKEEKEKVSLILPDGSEYAQNKKETDQKIQEIIGLTKNQFMQVVMIAQGEFMTLLREKTDTKKQIFRKLFHTERYQKLIEEVARRRKTQEQKIQEIQIQFRAETSHIELPEIAMCQEGNQELYHLVKQICQAEKLSITEMEHLLELFAPFCEQTEVLAEQAVHVQEKIIKERKEIQAQKERAKELLQAFEKLEEAEEKKKQYEEQKTLMQHLEVLSEQIQSAYRLKRLWDLSDQARRQLSELRDTLRLQKERLPAAQEECESVNKEHQKALERQEEILQEWTVISKNVKEEENRFAHLEILRQNIENKTSERKRADEQEQEMKDALEQFLEQKKQWKIQIADLPQMQAKLPGQTLLVQRFQSGLDLLEEKKKAQDAYRECQTACRKTQEVYLEKSRIYQQQHAEYENLRQTFLNVQAGLLAKEELKDGMPCPVCGSREHPAPCRLRKEDRNLTREMLEEKADEDAACQKAQEDASTKAQVAVLREQEAKKLLLEKEETLYAYLSQLGFEQSSEPQAEHVDENLEERFLYDGRKQAQKALTKLQKEIRAGEQIQQKLEEAEQTEQKLRRKLEEAADRTQTRIRELELLVQEQQQTEKEQRYPSLLDAQKELVQVTERREQIQKKQKVLQQKLQTALQEESAIHTLLEKCEQELPEQEKISLAHRQEYQKELFASGLEESQWQQVCEAYPLSQAESFAKQLEQYQKTEIEIENTIFNMQQIIACRKKPNLESLEMEQQEAESKEKEAREICTIYQNAAKQNRKIYHNLIVQMESRGSLLEVFGQLDHLYRVFSGKESGARMDLETYVQRYYLERILALANRRFYEMTDGQFALRMYDIEDAGQGRNKGLDLMVYSNVTGKIRDIRTLSGGESFMAALSLALGMADQIQESSSAIGLDVMFIDEGFGSLDEHARNQAVRVLREMAGSDRMIGIISHVTELKQEIEDQLIVTKDEKGSHVHWQIS